MSFIPSVQLLEDAPRGAALHSGFTFYPHVGLQGGGHHTGHDSDPFSHKKKHTLCFLYRRLHSRWALGLITKGGDHTAGFPFLNVKLLNHKHFRSLASFSGHLTATQNKP